MANPIAAKVLRTIRQRTAISQRTLASRARTAQSVVARIELGLTSPSVDTLQRIARAAGFDLSVDVAERPVLDRNAMADVPRILRLSAEDRLREVANLSAFVTHARKI